MAVSLKHNTYVWICRTIWPTNWRVFICTNLRTSYHNKRSLFNELVSIIDFKKDLKHQMLTIAYLYMFQQNKLLSIGIRQSSRTRSVPQYRYRLFQCILHGKYKIWSYLDVIFEIKLGMFIKLFTLVFLDEHKYLRWIFPYLCNAQAHKFPHPSTYQCHHTCTHRLYMCRIFQNNLRWYCTLV